MDFIEAVILGLIQGLTEFIPVSSSGHLVVAQNLFFGSASHLFLESINVGTVLALLVYFRTRIIAIIRDVIIDRNILLARNILITSLPAGVVGYLLSDWIERSALLGSSALVVCTLALVGVVMIVLERLPMASPRTLETLGAGRAFLVGAAQMFALIPGVSRSGSTIIAGRLLGLGPAAAAEYSFLASLPIMIGVTLKLFAGTQDRQYIMEHAAALLFGNAAAFLAGLLAVGFLLRYLAGHSLAAFGLYRLGLAAVVTIVILLQ